MGILGLAYGVLQNVKADRAHAKLRALVSAIPIRVASQVHRLLQPQERADEEYQPNRLQNADIDGDGEEEILLEYVAPATGVLLKAFDRNEEGDLVEVGWLFSQHPGFRYGDFDGDGKTEIVTHAVHPDEESVALAPRVELIWKWDKGGFREVTGFVWEDHHRPER